MGADIIEKVVGVGQYTADTSSLISRVSPLHAGL